MPSKSATDPKLKTSRLSRLSSLGGLAVNLVGSAAAAGARAVTGGRDAAMTALHEQTAKKLLATFGTMKGLPMKIGQVLSYMDGAIPVEYQDIYRTTLQRLQVMSEPLPWTTMRPFLEEQLGMSVEEAFASIDPQPLAAASIGQVMRAKMRDGRAVAVKIQYPGIDLALANDLSAARAIGVTLSKVLPNVDTERTTADIVARLSEECDYELEAANQTELGRLWADDPDVIIPTVVPELVRKRVLVTSLESGRSFDELTRLDAAERNAAGETLYWFVMRSLLTHGLFNADPHPGNFLFPGGRKVVFLDFGCVQRYDPGTVQALRALRDAAFAGIRGQDLFDLAAVAVGIDAPVPRPLRELFEEYLLLCMEPALAPQPFRFTSDYTRRMGELTAKGKKEMFRNVFKDGWPEPKREGAVFFNRILFGLNSLLAALAAEGAFRRLQADA